MDRIAQFGASAFASLSVQNYRRLFTSQAIALSGTWMQIVALGWLGLQVTGSGSQLGLIVAAQFLPVLVFGPLGMPDIDLGSAFFYKFLPYFIKTFALPSCCSY
jgi:hypothetical protein